MKQPSLLYDSLYERLNNYALAASAAGVAILAFSLPALGAPVCQNVSFTLSGTDTYSLNPANSLIAPFNLAATYTWPSSISSLRANRMFFTPNVPGADAVLAKNGFPADLPKNASIGPGAPFGKGLSYGLLLSTSRSRHRGNFQEGGVNLFGYRFLISGKIHYGWVRISGISGGNEINDYGYETTPNTPIHAGACETSGSKKPDVATDSAAVGRPEGSLGILAMGEPGLALWRR